MAWLPAGSWSSGCCRLRLSPALWPVRPAGTAVATTTCRADALQAIHNHVLAGFEAAGDDA